jgi:lysophospholipid acyltransferase
MIEHARALFDGANARWMSVVRVFSGTLGIPQGSAMFLLGLVCAPAIGGVFPCIDVALGARGLNARAESKAFVRSACALVFGIALSLMTFGKATTVCAHFGACAYATMLAARKRCGLIVFVGSFAYLIHYHAMADTANAWKRGEVDISGLLMVLTLKVTACAINYQDAATTKADEMSEFQNRRHLKKLPNILDYASWLMFPCTLVSGPAVEFRDYTDWLHDRGVWSGRKPNALVPALKKLAGGIVCLALHKWVTTYYTIENTYLSPTWSSYSFFEKVWHQYVYGQGNRFKYYFVWMFADFAGTVSGLGFSGYDAKGNARWETTSNIHPIGCEKAVAMNTIPLHWNVQTGMWLRHYVYDRVTPRGKKPGLLQLLITQTVSGIWHGLYAGYWLFFVSTAFAVNGSRLIYRWQHARVPKRLHLLVEIPHWFFSQFGLNYLCSSFVLIDFRNCLNDWASVHYWGHIAIVCMLIFGNLFGPKSTPKAKTA